MVAFILAAGYGTRLRPLTDTTPKALIEVGGQSMLERVARRCVEAGARQLVVNVSHLAEQVSSFLEDCGGFDVPCFTSEEPDGPLETGGGIKKAAHLLPSLEPVLVHNVDVLSDIDLPALLGAHLGEDPEPLATLAVKPAGGDRYLLFDDLGLLGYALRGEERQMRHPVGVPVRFDFCGVQIISAEMIDLIRIETEEKFSVMDLYLRLAKDAARIVPFEGAGHRCLDMGTHESLAEAEALIAERVE